MKPEGEVREHILAKATEDEGLRARLVADAKGSVEEEFGIRLLGGSAAWTSTRKTHNGPHDPAAVERTRRVELQAAAGGYDSIPSSYWQRVRRRRGTTATARREQEASSPSGPCPSGRARASVTR